MTTPVAEKSVKAAHSEQTPIKFEKKAFRLVKRVGAVALSLVGLPFVILAFVAWAPGAYISRVKHITGPIDRALIAIKNKLESFIDLYERVTSYAKNGK